MNTNAKKILQIAGLSVFFLFIIAFIFINSMDLMFGVKIKNVNITDGASARTTIQSGGKVTNNVLDITGIAKNAVNLTLNDREISIDKNGNFYENIILALGYNIIVIKAKDKFGNIDEKNYKLMLEK
ncbi:MAG: hypothetical protein AAB493_00350 [Patescibacteria group bacterium]